MRLKQKFLLECHVFLPAPNTDCLVELTNDIYMHAIYLQKQTKRYVKFTVVKRTAITMMLLLSEKKQL